MSGWRIPGPEKAVLDPEKIREYLLSETHPVGKFKARYFAALGFRREHWHELAKKLRDTVELEAVLAEVNRFGWKFKVRATLQGPSGRSAQVVVIWIVRVGESFPRFVTAYPGSGES